MKGIVLAGGLGSRLYPTTLGISKQMIPIYDKPMIFYPLSVLMLAEIREILIISSPQDISSFKRLLGNGSMFGLDISFAEQKKPRGLADAFLIGENFIEDEKVCLILGDNIFYGQGLTDILFRAKNRRSGATIFGHRVRQPERFGVIELDDEQNVKSIVEKPKVASSSLVATGLYFYDNEVIEIAKKVSMSNRNELEITDVNKVYLERRKLNVEILGRGFAWLDTGTYDSLIEANHFISSVENAQGQKVACLEEIAFRKNWISTDILLSRAELFSSTDYGQYLQQLVLEVGQPK